ncbi:chitin synthase-domain-containing protein [Mycena olivaceomarginata]|nr:chitin synthase-domain-containing protein [Mycena olivaceomarginata]
MDNVCTVQPPRFRASRAPASPSRYRARPALTVAPPSHVLPPHVLHPSAYRPFSRPPTHASAFHLAECPPHASSRARVSFERLLSPSLACLPSARSASVPLLSCPLVRFDAISLRARVLPARRALPVSASAACSTTALSLRHPCLSHAGAALRAYLILRALTWITPVPLRTRSCHVTPHSRPASKCAHFENARTSTSAHSAHACAPASPSRRRPSPPPLPRTHPTFLIAHLANILHALGGAGAESKEKERRTPPGGERAAKERAVPVAADKEAGNGEGTTPEQGQERACGIRTMERVVFPSVEPVPMAHGRYPSRRCRHRGRGWVWVREIEDWTGDIYKAAPGQYRPNVGKGGKVGRAEKRRTFLPSMSRFTPAEGVSGGKGGRATTAYGPLDGGAAGKRSTVYAGSIAPSSARGGSGTPPTLVGGGDRRSRSLMSWGEGSTPSARGAFADNPCPFPLLNIVPQPPADYEPFNYPLAHPICLVTAHSESVEGLRTTLDSLATTDYPNSHKLILVICDGYVKGVGNSLTTPEIVLTMMKEFVVPVPDVEAHSYVAIADGHKRHNMAKVYAGFYAYDDATVERSKQQRVPVVLVAKCGNPRKAGEAKPGNRGKRDSQIVLMGRADDDVRVRVFQFRVARHWGEPGAVFPDSLTRMVSCMVCDEEIMGLCGETKIANKAETFVTMMQVFEYYISHHMTKAFESMFGGVNCLPGCFSMYRIKAPKGDSGFWVPILANPDIVEHYSENVVDTLHKKNPLLLGEDRYLTTLMLKTFPKRKNMFCSSSAWSSRGRLSCPPPSSFTVYLIIASILPHHANTTISLILLAVVLGLPMVLIVITSRKWVYVGWMLIYLVSLPIWNGLLPAYAFWHFDDFSWGQTRMLEGGEAEGKGGGVEGDKEGEFDSSHIVMKRWAGFERERQWKSGTQSRDSDEYFKGKADSNRYSLGSNSDQYHPPSAGVDSTTVESTSAAGGYSAASPRSRHDSNDLMLPTPLAVSRHTTASAGISSSSSASVGMGRERSSEDGFGFDHGGNTSAHHLLPSPQSAVVDTWGDSYGYEPSPPMPPPKPYGRASMESGTPPGSANPFMTPRMSASASPVMYDEPEEASPVRGGGGGRGVRLTDSGPVPGPEGGVRRVARPSARRPTSQVPVGAGGQGMPQQQQGQQPNRYSRNSIRFSLPPGAAPPQSGYGQ